MPSLNVMSFNIANGLGSAERLEAALRVSEADVIGLVEVAPIHAKVLESLTDVYPHRGVFGRGIPGKAILSRWPLRQAHPIEFNPARPDVYAEVEWQGTLLRVVVAHPPPPTIATRAARGQQLQQLRDLVALPGALVLMGDFNMIPQQPGYHAILDIGLADAFVNAGRGPAGTFPTRRGPLPLLPLLRLDYIFHSSELAATDAWVGADAGSDHRSLFAQLVRR